MSPKLFPGAAGSHTGADLLRLLRRGGVRQEVRELLQQVPVRAEEQRHLRRYAAILSACFTAVTSFLFSEVLMAFPAPCKMCKI